MKIERGSRIAQLLDGTHDRRLGELLAQPNVIPPEQVAAAIRSATDDAWHESDPAGFRHTHATRAEAVEARKKAGG